MVSFRVEVYRLEIRGLAVVVRYVYQFLDVHDGGVDFDWRLRHLVP